MPIASIRSVLLRYETCGDKGAWLALNSGGRNSLDEMLPLAHAVAARGFRVLVHDRRNTGGSQMVFAGTDGEEEIWADDLVALMQAKAGLPAFFGGSSSGARLSMLVRRRHPHAVRGLLLMRVTGGAFAAGRLPTMYYRQFIEAAQRGGMAAVCDTEPYRERLAMNPANHAVLMAMQPAEYTRVMRHWLDCFEQGPRAPVMGMTDAELRSFNVPTLVVPGNDKTHAAANGRAAAQLIPGAELYELPIEDQDIDLIPFPDWGGHVPLLADRFAEFMVRHGAPPSGPEGSSLA